MLRPIPSCCTCQLGKTCHGGLLLSHRLILTGGQPSARRLRSRLGRARHKTRHRPGLNPRVAALSGLLPIPHRRSPDQAAQLQSGRYDDPKGRVSNPSRQSSASWCAQQSSTATPSTASDPVRLPSTADLPQRPRMTSPPGVRIEGVAGPSPPCDSQGRTSDPPDQSLPYP
jgi:hypothetical protein